jgi:hypothetical protein
MRFKGCFGNGLKGELMISLRNIRFCTWSASSNRQPFCRKNKQKAEVGLNTPPFHPWLGNQHPGTRKKGEKETKKEKRKKKRKDGRKKEKKKEEGDDEEKKETE